MTEAFVRCEKFKPRPQPLRQADTIHNPGPCRYHRGGDICARKDVFLCHTDGYAVRPWRADSDEDGDE